MIEIRKKLKVRPGAYQIQAKGRIELPFEQRCKSRTLAALADGEEVALKLPRGEVLRGGDMVVASDGRIIEVIASKEKVLHVTCPTANALVKAAYHLGNRHVAVQVGEGWLRIAADHVLEGMLRGLGATVRALEAPFEPEPGAYAGDGHAHVDDGHGGRIHEYGEPDEDEGHVHGPDCGHDHAEHEHEHEHAGHAHEDAAHEHASHAHEVAAHVHAHADGHGHDHEHGNKQADEHVHDHEKAHGHEHANEHGHAPADSQAPASANDSTHAHAEVHAEIHAEVHTHAHESEHAPDHDGAHQHETTHKPH